MRVARVRGHNAWHARGELDGARGAAIRTLARDGVANLRIEDDFQLINGVGWVVSARQVRAELIEDDGDAAAEVVAGQVLDLTDLVEPQGAAVGLRMQLCHTRCIRHCSRRLAAARPAKQHDRATRVVGANPVPPAEDSLGVVAEVDIAEELLRRHRREVTNVRHKRVVDGDEELALGSLVQCLEHSLESGRIRSDEALTLAAGMLGLALAGLDVMQDVVHVTASPFTHHGVSIMAVLNIHGEVAAALSLRPRPSLHETILDVLLLESHATHPRSGARGDLKLLTDCDDTARPQHQGRQDLTDVGHHGAPDGHHAARALEMIEESARIAPILELQHYQVAALETIHGRRLLEAMLFIEFHKDRAIDVSITIHQMHCAR
mmetsp:Transcript_75980/g.246629  ORF Transcript_75980/g.246629 Transcript_75980/m.246629 type:complete len:378 (+) Transcript_75980:586-1719(+)